MKRVALSTAAALSVLGLTTLTACGGDGGSDTANEKPEATASASAAKQPAPAQRLAGLMVKTADVDGFTVGKYDTEYALATSPGEVTVDEPACAPLAYAMNQLPLGDAEAHLTRTLSGEADGSKSTTTYITLASYATGGAEAAVAGVRKAVESCGGGFTAEGSGGGTSAYDAVRAEKVAPAGDESLGFATTMSYQGVSHVLRTEVVRAGDVVAVYFAVDGMAIATSRPSDAKLTASVVKAQNGKLG